MYLSKKNQGPVVGSLVLLATAGSLVHAGSPADQAVQNPGAPSEEGYDAVAGEVIVRFNAKANSKHVEAVLARVGGKLLKHKRSKIAEEEGQNGVTLISVNLPVPQAVAALNNFPGVDNVEPNYVYQKQNSTSWVNDQFYGDSQFPLWGMYGPTSGNVSSPANTYGTQADETWWLGLNGSLVPLANVYVGVIDEGICYYHPELLGQVDNPAEGGYGRDFYNDDNTIFDPVTGSPDIDAHGTHVSGTISAKINNTYGVVGIYPSVHIISAKFLGPDGGTTLDAIDAVDYFTDLKKNQGVNVVALNNSWGGGGYSAELHAAIIRAAKEGILFVAAAGNGNRFGIGQNNDSLPSYPASYNTTQPVTIGSTTYVANYDSVIAVAAIDSSGNKAGFSNYGAQSVDIGAPGVGIVSTYPYNLAGSDAKSVASRDPVRGAYMPYNGTSMATPHVTGAAALYAAVWPSASAAAIKGSILKTATATSSLTGKCVSGGRLNIARVTEAPQEAPATPLNLNASAGSGRGQVNLAWSDSDTETKYELQRASNATFTSSLAMVTLNANVTSYADKDKNLKSGSTVYYRIRALNYTGASTYSTTAAVKVP